MDNFLDNAAGASDSDVLVTAGAVLVELQPVLNAPFAEQLVAVIALLCLTANFEADLAENESSKLLAYLESTDTVGIIADWPEHFNSIILVIDIGKYT